MTYKGKQIIFSDLDSTLLRNNHYFSKATKQVVKDLYKKGVFLIPVTARSTFDVITQAKRLGIDKIGGIAAANNGSQIYDFKNKTWIVNEYLNNETVKIMFEEFFGKHKAKIHFYADDTTYVFNEGKMSLYWAQMMGTDYIAAHSFEEIKHKISHATIVLKKGTPTDEAKSMLKFIQDNFSEKNDVQVYTERVIEICPKGINKGSAVKNICDYLNIGEEVVKYAFGDGPNDFPMFEAVEVGVAMANAIQELKSSADDVTEFSNEEDGVARYIYKNIL
ncbi:Cof-type HAD-IIB family hydrolase [Mesoplasma photuris]|uniref:Cof-type HAD-IIB family hydrolase n=1 Tax=Mesoplasma photuris TaxID=217731 RepID=UPI0004E0C021|nr:Cof-type HAD-IIB family hydrolase [Mesoplasma photuris]